MRKPPVANQPEQPAQGQEPRLGLRGAGQNIMEPYGTAPENRALNNVQPDTAPAVAEQDMLPPILSKCDRRPSCKPREIETVWITGFPGTRPHRQNGGIDRISPQDTSPCRGQERAFCESRAPRSAKPASTVRSRLPSQRILFRPFCSRRRHSARRAAAIPMQGQRDPYPPAPGRIEGCANRKDRSDRPSSRP